MHSLEILAVIMIVFVFLKFLIFALNPKRDKKFTKKFYSKPDLIKFIALVLALMILYILTNSGLTIVDILAVSLFLALVLVVALADFMGTFVKKIKTKDLLKKELWYILLWLFLIIWGIRAIFF